MLPRSFALVAALTLTLPRVAPSQTDDLVVRPSAIQVSVTAVPPLVPREGSERLETGTLCRVIERNLVISGWFAAPTEPQLVVAQDALDRRRDETDFDEWQRLGANYLARGDYDLRGGQLTVELEVFDVTVGRRVFGRSYQRPAEQVRDTAHQIADDIIESLVGELGIARSRILFITVTGGGRELGVMDADGGRRRQLTRDNATVMSSCWGMNNTEVYFTTTREFNPDLCGMFLDGGAPWFISRLPGLNLSPHWSAVTRRIALTLSRDGNSELYTMSREGERLLRLTYQRAIDSSPCWTPDGRRLLFTSDRDGRRPQIWQMTADGRQQQRLTNRSGHGYNDGATISPDGRHVAFTSKVNNQFDIFLMDIGGDSDSWVRLTDHPGDDEDPSWTWDGQHLVFSSDRTGRRQIHIMNADGSNVHQLTRSGDNLSPIAEPLPSRN